jgi:hypothetical protein
VGIVTDLFRVTEVDASTAHLVPPLLYRVFGYSYTDISLYETDGVLRSISGGNNIFLIAHAGDSAGALLAMRFSFPSSSIAELGMLVVDPVVPSQTGGRLLQLLVQTLTTRVFEFAHTRGLRGLISTEVTVHTMTQRLVSQIGFVCTGMYIGWAPAWAERLRVIPGDRLPSEATCKRFCHRRTETVSALAFDKMVTPYQAILPAAFESPLRTIYAALAAPVTFIKSVPAAGETQLFETLNLVRSRAIIELVKVGADATARVLERLAHYRDGGIDLIHVALPLSETSIDDIVDALLAAGCRYAALIPLYRGHDVIMLQYLNNVPIDVTEHDFHTPLARMLFRDVVTPSAASLPVRSR